MTLDFSLPGEVIMDMVPYIGKIIGTFPEQITGVQSTPAAGDHEYQIQADRDTRISPEGANQNLPSFNGTAPFPILSAMWCDIQQTVAFLTATSVKCPEEYDRGKLKHFLKCLHAAQHLPLTLFAESLSDIVWYVDASAPNP